MFGHAISCSSITPPITPHVAQPKTSGNADFLASLRDKLTGVANDSTQPLPPGLLERIDSSQATGKIDMALTNDISAYLTSVQNKLSDDITKSNSPIEDNSGDKPKGTTPNVTILQKVMRETLRVINQAKELNDTKINQEAGRIIEQLKAFNEGTLKREINRIEKQINELLNNVKKKTPSEEQVNDEINRFKDNTSRETDRIPQQLQQLDNEKLKKEIHRVEDPVKKFFKW